MKNYFIHQYEINYYLKDDISRHDIINIYDEKFDQKITELKDNPNVIHIIGFELETECYPSENGEDYEFNVVDKWKCFEWSRKL